MAPGCSQGARHSFPKQKVLEDMGSRLSTGFSQAWPGTLRKGHLHIACAFNPMMLGVTLSVFGFWGNGDSET